MPPYDEAQGVAFQRDDVLASYAEAGFTPDLENVVWSNRMTADAVTSLGYHASRAKHRRELRRQLGLDGPGPSPIVRRLRRDGRTLVSDAGRYDWRMVTAFRLVQMASRGEDIAPFLGWCRDHRVGVRVFVMCWNMFDLDPVDGRAVLPIVLQAAAERGVYVEVCCLADTFVYTFDVRTHVSECGAICDRFENAVLEGANEPAQHWQPFKPLELDALIQTVPSSVACTLGGPDGDNDESTAYITDRSSYAVAHTARSGSPWRRVRHIREQQVVSDHLNIYTVDDEPENAKELTDAQLFACGAIAAVCQFGQTHHADFGKHCTLPTDDEQRRFDARRRGWDSVPATFWGTFANYNWRPPLPESPLSKVELLSDDGRAYSSITDSESYTVLSHANSPTFKSGWHADRIAGDDDASVWRAIR